MYFRNEFGEDKKAFGIATGSNPSRMNDASTPSKCWTMYIHSKDCARSKN
jgi:hypothetical protein